MTATDLAELGKAAGLPGLMIALFIWYASRRDLTRREEPDDVGAKLDRINDKLDAIRDRTTIVEAEIKGLSRRVDRLDR